MYEQIIDIDENNRLLVTVDESASDPCEWGWDVEVHDIANYRWWAFGEMPEDPVAYAASEFYARFNRDKDKTKRALGLYLNLLGDTREFEIHGFVGYSPGDWATVLEIGNDLGLYSVYAAWRRGDVYNVAHQERVVYARIDGDDIDPDDIHEEWEVVDGISECYLNDEYTALDVAREHFGIEIKTEG